MTARVRDVGAASGLSLAGEHVSLPSRLVLSLFPGADLLGRAFERAGFCVVRGPDSLWGGDVRDFHPPPGVFAGVIGGPPCQVHSNLTAMSGTNAVDLIPEFLRVVNEAAPRWAIMENVPAARKAGPDWPQTLVRDWDVGGLTSRIRRFWFFGIPAAPRPVHRRGEPSYSVLASNWKGRTGVSGKGGTTGMHQTLTPTDAARLQGFDGLAQRIIDAQSDGVSQAAGRVLAIHMLGNGVPLAMGAYLARWVLAQTEGQTMQAAAQMSLPVVAEVSA